MNNFFAPAQAPSTPPRATAPRAPYDSLWRAVLYAAIVDFLRTEPFSQAEMRDVLSTLLDDEETALNVLPSSEISHALRNRLRWLPLAPQQGYQQIERMLSTDDSPNIPGLLVNRLPFWLREHFQGPLLMRLQNAHANLLAVLNQMGAHQAPNLLAAVAEPVAIVSDDEDSVMSLQ